RSFSCAVAVPSEAKQYSKRRTLEQLRHPFPPEREKNRKPERERKKKKRDQEQRWKQGEKETTKMKKTAKKKKKEERDPCLRIALENLRKPMKYDHTFV